MDQSSNTIVKQVGGNHYTDDARCPHCDGILNHWDLFAKAPYLIGNATKYLARFGKKVGEDQMENLLKARSYLDKQIAVLTMDRKREAANQTVPDSQRTRVSSVKRRKGVE